MSRSPHKLPTSLSLEEELDDTKSNSNERASLITEGAYVASLDTTLRMLKYFSEKPPQKAFLQQLLDSPDAIPSTQVRHNLTLEEQFLLLSLAMNEDNNTDED